MNTIYLFIAGFCIKVVFGPLIVTFTRDKLILDIKTIYKGFILNRPLIKPDFIINIDEPYHHFITKKIKSENYYFSYIFKTSDGITLHTAYDISLHQFSHLITNVIQKKLGENKGFLLHASASNVKNKAFLFAGLSGAGKSTTISLLNNTYPALSDDLSIIKKEGKGFVYYQTPFIEKNAWVKKGRKKYTIGKLFFIRKSQEFKVEKITSKKYVTYELTKQLRVESQTLKSNMKNLLSFVQNFNEYYFLYFAKNSTKLVNLLNNLS